MKVLMLAAVGCCCAAFFLPTAGLPQVVLAKRGLFLLCVFEDAVGIWPTEARLHTRENANSIGSMCSRPCHPLHVRSRRKDNHFVDGANLLELSSLDRATPESQVHSCDRGWALLQVEPAGWRSTSSMAGIHEFFVWSAQSTQPRLWTTRSAFSKPAYLSL